MSEDVRDPLNIWLYTGKNGRPNIWCDRCGEYIDTSDGDEGYPSERKSFSVVLTEVQRHIEAEHR